MAPVAVGTDDVLPLSFVARRGDTNSPSLRARRSTSGSLINVGKMPLGSLKPLSPFANSVGIPGIEPIIIGFWASSPSKKNPITHEPSTRPVADLPIPLIDAEVEGCIH